MAHVHVTLHVPADQHARLWRALATVTAWPWVETGREGVGRLLRRGATRIEARLARAGPLQLRLVAGSAQGLLELAASWLGRYRLCLDLQPGLVDLAGPMKSKQGCDAALRQMVASCLAQALPQLLALSTAPGDAEALHQLRVSLRRLRSVLREFSDWSAALDPQWDARLGALSLPLGVRRDDDVLAATLLPQLRAAGAPMLALPVPASAEPAHAILRSPETQRLLMELLVYAQGDATLESKHDEVRAGATAALRRQHGRLLKQGAALLAAGDAERHRLRKRVKRLRYCIELCAPLYRGKALRPCLAELRRLQEALGELNDLCMAETVFSAQLDQDARAWFALGWLAARREPCLRAAAVALDALAKAPRFWRR